MAKTKNVTDAEVIACFTSAENLLAEMQDFANRIRGGYVDRIEDAPEAARQFALIAKAASDMTAALLTAHEMQKQKDEVAALKARLADEQ